MCLWFSRYTDGAMLVFLLAAMFFFCFVILLQWFLHGLSLSNRQDELFTDGQEKIMRLVGDAKTSLVADRLRGLYDKMVFLEQAKPISSIPLSPVEKLQALKSFEGSSSAWHQVPDPKSGQASQKD